MDGAQATDEREAADRDILRPKSIIFYPLK